MVPMSRSTKGWDIRAFYYPTFYFFSNCSSWLRVTLATLAAVTVRNLLWGHMVEAFFYDGANMPAAAWFFQTWPYFILLGVGITSTELYLLRKKTGANLGP